jgi:hypothetical protein
MKKIVSLLLVASIGAIGFSASPGSAATSAGIIDEGYIPPDLPLKGVVNINFKDGRFAALDAGAPYLIWSNGGVTSRGIEQAVICQSVKDAKCDQSQGYLEFFTRLILCSDSLQLDCIEGITAETSQGKFQGVFIEAFPKKIVTSYLSNSQIRLPNASSAGFWKFEDINHPGGNQFFVDASLRGRMSSGEGVFTNSSLNISIHAASKKPLGRHTTSPEFGSVLDDGSSYVIQRNATNLAEGYLGAVGIYGGYENETLDCVMSGDNLCANRHAIPEGVQFSIKLRLSSSPSGWLHGRLDQPNVEITSIAPAPAIQLALSGSSTRVPAVGITKKWVELPDSLRDTYSNGGFIGSKYGCRWCSPDPLQNTLSANPSASGEGAISELKAWLPLVEEKSSADLNTWSIRTLSPTEMNGADRCFTKTNQINGLVMTNSTVYSAGPPQFNSGTLDYQVAAPHYMSNGEVFKGQYNLVMRSDVARCIYKFSSAPIQASLSIVNSNGSSQVATMVIGERGGWLYLNANNFEFSSPLVRFTLSQDAAPQPTPEMSATPKPLSTSKKITIACSKGKTRKSVTGINPKCPNGYKKVSK